MGTPGNISLNVKSQGLSYAIDSKLDEELQTDVKLGYKEWTSVFELIKNDQVAENKSQFGEKDTDIKNGKHFIVQANENYEIKQSVWAQIVEIAKKKMGITTLPAAAAAAREENVTENNAAAQNVKTILKNANIDIDETSDDFNDIVNKYNAIKSVKPDITDENLAERISNYAKGLQYHKTEMKFAARDTSTAATIDGVEEAVNTGDMEKFKAAFHQKAKEYIELYDSADGDGKISVDELIAMEEKELGRALTDKERAIVQEEAINRIAILNQDNDAATLNEDEIAAYLWAMSKINDGNDKKTAHDITADEWNTSQESMGIFSGTSLTDEQLNIITPAFKLIKKTGKTLDELYLMNDLYGLKISDEEKNTLSKALSLLAENGFSQEMIDNYDKFAQALRNGYEGLKQ